MQCELKDLWKSIHTIKNQKGNYYNNCIDEWKGEGWQPWAIIEFDSFLTR